MNFIALNMLVGDRAKYLGILMGLTFASLLLTQQAGIFVGLMSRTFGFLTDTSLPDIWVMDEKVQFVDDVKPLRDTDVKRSPSRGRGHLPGDADVSIAADGLYDLFARYDIRAPGRPGTRSLPLTTAPRARNWRSSRRPCRSRRRPSIKPPTSLPWHKA
jgi:hypothetical protein